MTARERAVAEEIVRLGQEELRLGVELSGGPDAELASALDSLQLLSLVTAVEDRFRVRLGEEDAATTRSLADLARLVVQKQAEGGAAAGEGP